MDRKVLIGISLILAALFILFFFLNPQTPAEYHTHSDFKVYLGGVAVDFSQDKYMTSEEQLISPFVHLHDGDGELIHVHYEGITLRQFFNSLKMDVNSSCFVLDDKTQYCNNNQNQLKLYVNGKQVTEIASYKPQDLDRILISYGAENEVELKQQIDSVSNNACIQSSKCPERGKASDESSCTTALGCVA